MRPLVGRAPYPISSSTSLHGRITFSLRIYHAGAVPPRLLPFQSLSPGCARHICAARYGRNTNGMISVPLSARVQRVLRFSSSGIDNKDIREGEDIVSTDHYGRQHVLPAAKAGKAGNGISSGKLLATPSRLLKLVIPLSVLRLEAHGTDSEPLAIVLHPQQPLSYLERVIQSEVPPVVGEKGQWRPPAVSFISLQLDKDAIRPKRAVHEHHDVTVNGVKAKDVRRPNNDDRRHSERRYHRIHKETDKPSSYQHLREHGEKTVPSGEQFVRWSHSTEIGDFLRDASRACDFIVSIEGARAGLSQKIRVTVPTFNQRTYFLRMRLRKISRQLKSTAELKHECDVLAQRGAQRVAILGLFVLATWWCFVYVMTFQTELGWNTMEPVTYLVSLSSFMGGYLWFLYHNREISYKSALDFTVSARQRRLYQAKGVDLQLWGTLLDEGKALRREIKSIAEEYDVDWNERADEQDEQVTQALKEKHHKSQVDGKRDTNEDGEEESK